MLCIISDEDFSAAFPDCSSNFVVVVSDHFSNEPAAIPIIATGYQLETLCLSICAKETAQIFEQLKSSKFYRHTIHVCSLACVQHMLDCLQD